MLRKIMQLKNFSNPSSLFYQRREGKNLFRARFFLLLLKLFRRNFFARLFGRLFLVQHKRFETLNECANERTSESK